MFGNLKKLFGKRSEPPPEPITPPPPPPPPAPPPRAPVSGSPPAAPPPRAETAFVSAQDDQPLTFNLRTIVAKFPDLLKTKVGKVPADATVTVRPKGLID